MALSGTGTSSAALDQTTEHDSDVLPWRPFRVSVARLRRLSPTFQRITFTGDDLHQFGWHGPDQRLKLHIPQPGQGLPDLRPCDWYAHYRRSDPRTRGFVRTYTIRAARPDRCELDVDFVLHGGPSYRSSGPAAQWAAHARPGDELVVIGPNRAFPGDCQGYEWNPPPGARDIVIAGDETAVPAIGGILEQLRHDGRTASWRVRAFLEVPSPADVLDLAAPEHAEISWLPRLRPDGSTARHGDLLVDAVPAADLENVTLTGDTSLVDTLDIDLEVLWDVATRASSVYAWVAGEAGAVRTIRRKLVRERGIEKGSVTFMGYWRLGRTLDS